MAKNTEKNSSPAEEPAPAKAGKPSKTNFVPKMAAVVLLLAVLGGGWYMIQNPKFLNKTQENEVSLNREIEGLKEQIALMNSQIQALQAEKNQNINRDEWEKINNTFVKRTAILNKKINDSLKVNHDLLDSKASNSAVLGLVTRVDGLETKVRTLGKVSSQGALILTAAMLVKDAAADGRPFVYEAEVLRQLAAGTNMETAAETIARLAPAGIATQNMLIGAFNNLYAEQQDALKEKDTKTDASAAGDGWKEKLNAKLSKLIVVEYNGDNSVGDVQNQNEEEDKVYRLVNSGNLSAAMLLMQAEPAYQGEAFKKWQEEYARSEEFNTALQKIQALTLAFMKVENIKNESVLQQP